MARTGIPWRDLPKAFGHWDAVYNRFRRWEKRRVWRRLWEGLQGEECTRAKALFINHTTGATHVLLERKGAKVGLLTTEGH